MSVRTCDVTKLRWLVSQLQQHSSSAATAALKQGSQGKRAEWASEEKCKGSLKSFSLRPKLRVCGLYRPFPLLE